MSKRGYCVYEHVFPNGKRYIGITSDIENRWRSGEGYKQQKKIYNAIKKYGWSNIEHNVILGDLTIEQAQGLEIYLIKTLGTIKNGYNVSIGGENISTSYLDSDILAFIRAAKRLRFKVCPIRFTDGDFSLYELCEMDEDDPEVCEMWNKWSEAVKKKHGKCSATNEDDVIDFWWHMREIYLLSLAIERGEDVSNWKERKRGDISGLWFDAPKRKGNSEDE